MMAFGTIYTPTNSAYATTATVTVSCSGNGTDTSVRICPFVGSGTYGAAAGGPRLLGSGSARLNFDVFTSASYATRYPNDTVDATTPSTTLAVAATGTSSTTLTLYGRIPANQTAAATGDYAAAFSSGVFYGPAANFADCGTVVGQGQAAVSLQVAATNSPTCTVTASPVAFGSVASLVSVVNAVGAVGVTCSSGAAYSVALNGGTNGGTSATNRRMASGASRITYGLYRDSARTQGWYSDANTTATGTGTGSMQSIAVYGRVPVQATPPSGTYADTVTVTLTY